MGRQKALDGAQKFVSKRLNMRFAGHAGHLRKTLGDRWVGRMWMKMWMGNGDTVARLDNQEDKGLSVVTDVDGRPGCGGGTLRYATLNRR